MENSDEADFLHMQLVLLVGAKLQNIVATLALESVNTNEYYSEPTLQPRDELFWFKKPELLLYLIHFILFQVSYYFASMITLHNLHPPIT